MRPRTHTKSLSFHLVAFFLPAISLVGSGLLAFAYFSHGGEEVVSHVHAQDSASLYTTLTSHDSNNNGQADWEDALFSWQQRGDESDILTSSETEADFVGSAQTVTAQVGRNLLGNYLAMKRSGEFAHGGKERLLEEILHTANTLPQVKSFSPNDLIALPHTDNDTVRIYQQSIGQCTESLKTFRTNELILFSLALERQDTEAKEELRKLAQAYGNVATCMQSVPTPHIFLDEHAQLISHLHLWHYDLESLTVFDTDPVRTLSRVPYIDIDANKARTSLFNLTRKLATQLQ